jgi:hypothetical protein
MAVVLLAAATFLVAGAVADGLTTVTVHRCGYVNAGKAGYGENGIYPWHMSCAQARQVVLGSHDPHAKVIDFTAPGADGGAVQIDGRWWVCTGQMGYYNCGYPYRPARVAGGTAYRGPFTQDEVNIACDVVSPKGCPASTVFYRPPS